MHPVRQKGSSKNPSAFGFGFKMEKPVCMYWVTCNDPDHFYIGVSSDPNLRKSNHASGKGAFFIKNHGFKNFRILVWFNSRKDACAAEQHYTHIMRRKYKSYVIAGDKLGHLD